MSHWLTIIGLMYLLLPLLLHLQPPLENLPALTVPRADPLPWVMRHDYGLATAAPKRTRVEKLAAALGRAVQN